VKLKKHLAELSLNEIGLQFDEILQIGLFFSLIEKNGSYLQKWVKNYCFRKSDEEIQNNPLLQWIWYTHMLYPKLYAEIPRLGTENYSPSDSIQTIKDDSKIDFCLLTPNLFKLKVLQYLDDYDILELCMVNSYFHSCFNDDFWKMKFDTLEVDLPALSINNSNISWKHLYFQKKDIIVHSNIRYNIRTVSNYEACISFCTIQ